MARSAPGARCASRARRRLGRRARGGGLSTAFKLGLALTALFGSTFLLNLSLGWFGPESVEAWLRALSARPALVFAGLVAALAIDSVLSVPTMAAVIVGGHLLGPAAGGVAATLGMVLAGAICYWGARLAGGSRFADAAAVERVRRTIGEVGPAPLLLSRALPMMPEVLSALAGVGRMPAARYHAWFTLGNLPAAFVGAYAGSVSSLADPWPAVAAAAGVPAASGLLLLGLRRRRAAARSEPAPG